MLNDDFARADGTTVGGRWVEVVGDWEIASQKLKITATTNAIISTGLSHGPRVFLQAGVRFSGFVDKVRLIISYVDPDNYDYAEYTSTGAPGTGGFVIGRRSSGTDAVVVTHSDFTPPKTVPQGTDLTCTICTDSNHISAAISGVGISGEIWARMSSPGGKAALGTGGTMAGNVLFDNVLLKEVTDEYVPTDCGVCYECNNYCLPGTTPSQIQVVISGAVGACSDANGTWLLDPILITTACNFKSTTSPPGVDIVSASITGAATPTILSVAYQDEGSAANSIEWNDNPIGSSAAGRKTCNEFADVSVPWDSEVGTCVGNSGATCYVTAIP